MAQKRINQLQLIDAIADDLNLPGDNGIQTYRATALQLLQYVLAAGNVPLSALNASIFNGLTGVAPAVDDYLPIVDTSDSNKTKKILLASLLNPVYRSVTTTDTAGVGDEVLVLSGASFTQTLPTAVGVTGKKYKLIHAGTSLTQVYTIQTTSSQTIGGVAGGSYALYTAGEILEVMSNGANWIIIGRKTQTAAVSYTPTSNITQNTTASGLWWREGQFMHGIGKLAMTGAINNPGTDADFTLPGGTIDYGQLLLMSNVSILPVGKAFVAFSSASSVNDMRCYVNSADTNKIRFGALQTIATHTGTVFPYDTGITPTAPGTWANGGNVVGQFKVPITGWQP